MYVSLTISVAISGKHYSKKILCFHKNHETQLVNFGRKKAGKFQFFIKKTIKDGVRSFIRSINLAL